MLGDSLRNTNRSGYQYFNDTIQRAITPMNQVESDRYHLHSLATDANKQDVQKKIQEDKIIASLKEEFKHIDINKDGQIDYKEIQREIFKKAGELSIENKQYLETKLEEVFQRMDADRNNFVSIDEFVKEYFIENRILQDDISILETQISEKDFAIQEYQKQLNEKRQSERRTKVRHQVHGTYLMEHSTLKVEVIEGRDLIYNGRPLQKPVLKMKVGEYVEKSEAASKFNQKSDPIWNQVFIFDIKTGQETLKFKFFDGTQPIEGWELEIPLDIFIEEQQQDMIDQQVLNKIFEINQNLSYGSPIQVHPPQLHLQLQWIYSYIKLIEDLITKEKEQKSQMEHDLQQRKFEYENLAGPFAGVFLVSGKKPNPVKFQRSISLDYKVTDVEKNAAVKLDKFVTSLAGNEIKWSRQVMILTIIFTILVMITSMTHTDSMNVTVCALAIYCLTDPFEGQKKQFRAMTAGLVISLVYDMVWQFMKDSPESQLEGFQDSNFITSFAKWMQVILIGFKFILITVFWKVSIENN